MTKEEAIKAMQTHRVRHRFFSKEEWVTQCTNGKLCLEDGVMCDPEEFWRYRQVLYGMMDGKLYLIPKGV